MPTIPVFNQNQVTPRPLPGVNVIPTQETAGASIGNALKESSDVIQRIQVEERNNADTAAVTAAHAQLNSWVTGALYTNDDAAFKLKGKDAFDLESQVLPKYQQQVNEISNALTTPRQKRAFSQAATEFQSQIQRQLGTYELGERNQYYDETDASSRALSAERASLSYTDPTVMQQSLRDTLASVKNEGRRKGWDETTTAAQSFKALDAFHNTVIDGMLAGGDVTTASKYLVQNFTQMSAATSESIQRRLLTAESQALALSEHRQKIAGDAATKEGDNLLANGGLSAAWIEKNRAVLSPEDYRYFYKALTGEGEAPRNPMLYADLRDRAGRGEDVRNDAREALRAGRIRVGDYDRIVGEVEQERPGWYKRGTEYISTMSGVSQLNPDPAGAQNKATMLDQWGDWAATHKDASDREAQIAYQDIVSHNMLVKLSGLPLPKFAVGSRLQMNLKATEAETVKAFNSGQIDKQEFERQAKLLKDWRAAMSNAAPEAKP